MRLLALALAVTAIAAAQTAPGTGAVEGQVTSLTGEPLRKATVVLIRGGSTGNPANAGAAITGSDGKFVIEDIPPGSYTLLGSRAGYLPTGNGVPLPGGLVGKPVEVQSGSRLTGINLILTPQSIISGHVVDEDGDEVGVVSVAVYRVGWPGGTKQLMRVNPGVVNPDASYMAGNLPPGRYYVAASSQVFPDAHEAYFETFFPHTTDATAAIPIDIGPGEQIRDIDIRLIKGPLFHIRGRATGSAVGSGSTVILELVRRGSEQAAMGAPQRKLANIPADGAFSIENITPGAYVIQSGLSTAIAQVPVTITDHDIDDLAVPVGAGLTLTGTVKVEGDGAPGSLAFVLQPIDEPFRVLNTPLAATGKFEIRELKPVLYRFALEGLNPDVWVKEARSGSAVLTGDTLDLTDGLGTSLEISLAQHAASVGGIVRNGDGDPMANVPVVVWPVSGDGATLVMSTGVDGRFQFGSLAPGDYLVAAWEELEDGLAQNREFRSRFEGPATKVSLGESAHQELELTAIPKGVTEAAIRALY
jgi:hypothetical protein